MVSVRLADCEDDFQRIHRLNYETFVEEIPQHNTNNRKILVDQFHKENCYFIAEIDGSLVGMCAVRDIRPFSLDNKISRIEDFLPSFKKPLEVRLLSVKKEFRNSAIASAIFKEIAKYTLNNGYDIILISGTTRQLEMYSKLGFKPFHPAVGKDGAMYVPMFLTGADLVEQLISRTVLPQSEKPRCYNFLPGPVHMSDGVKGALQEEPISHRSPDGVKLLQDTRRKLCEFTKAQKVVIVPGSGTLGNEIVADQLRALPKKGLVLINGEFGERLKGIAKRIGLIFDSYDVGWGQQFCGTTLKEKLEEFQYSWVWMVAHETSTGMRNNFEEVKNIARAYGCLVALDCVSALGAYPLNLEDIAFASATSGKALGAPAGFAIVFYEADKLQSNINSHGYLSLNFWDKNESMPYTFSTSLLHALAMGLMECTSSRMDCIRLKTELIHNYMEGLGFSCRVPLEQNAPGMVTVAMSDSQSYKELMHELEALKIWVNWRGGYLEGKNMFQLSLFGDPPWENILFMLKSLGNFVK